MLNADSSSQYQWQYKSEQSLWIETIVETYNHNFRPPKTGFYRACVKQVCSIWLFVPVDDTAYNFKTYMELIDWLEQKNSENIYIYDWTGKAHQIEDLKNKTGNWIIKLCERENCYVLKVICQK